uniref:FMN dependent NADH:quinone oxidoreductase n=1 Tax=uncultured bacterium EIL4H10 TaxID=1768203 RepID=A0A0U2N6C0_9BACT|nr:putative FMN-dependent NADH-azoreductase [uncultured bacterium EIL4H10]
MTVMSPKILRIDGSTRHSDSVSRGLTDLATASLQDHFGVTQVIQRETRSGIGNVSSAWRRASLTPNETRSSEDRAVLAQSEALMNELAEADLLLIAVPIYNFSIPAALKSWIDLICRDNVDGARAKNLAGQFKNKQAMIILTSNYTNAYADDDFATPYLKFIMKFIGIDSVTFIDATGLGNDQAGVLSRAQQAVKSHCMKIAEIWDKQTAAE